MTQSSRILAALRNGPVRPTDFTGPTVDGGPPVLRVAARIAELRDQGYDIESGRAGNGCAIYTLTAEAGSTAGERPEGPTSTDPAPAVSLFACEDPTVGLSHYRADRAA